MVPSTDPSHGPSRFGRTLNDTTDRLGAVASCLCAAHCAVCFVLPAAIGALGLGFLLSEAVESAFIVSATVLAAGAFGLGWARGRPPLVLGLLLAGTLGLIGSGLVHALSHETPTAEPHGEPMAAAALGVAAGLLLTAGHLLGLRASKRVGAERARPSAG